MGSVIDWQFVGNTFRQESADSSRLVNRMAAKAKKERFV